MNNKKPPLIIALQLLLHAQKRSIISRPEKRLIYKEKRISVLK